MAKRSYSDESETVQTAKKVTKRTFIKWANLKNNLGSAVGAAGRQKIIFTDEFTESEYDKAIEKYRGEPPPRLK